MVDRTHLHSVANSSEIIHQHTIVPNYFYAKVKQVISDDPEVENMSSVSRRSKHNSTFERSPWTSRSIPM